MFCEALHDEDDVYHAYLLYASLYGVSTEEQLVRQRINAYLHQNQPDEFIDAALLAVSEDHIVAPPDVILGQWGKSRVYELVSLPTGGWRHQVCENWFDAGCRFSTASPRLSHFWTSLQCNAASQTAPSSELATGSRCSLRLSEGSEVQVVYRRENILGNLPKPLANEMAGSVDEDVHYLVLVDNVTSDYCKLLITRALSDVAVNDVVEYAANAFTTPRNKC